MFTLFTGLRPGEVRGLLADCVDWNACTITVKRMWCTKRNRLAQYTKTRKTRVIPIPRVILDQLADKKGLAPDQQLFPETCNSYGWITLKPLMEAAGVRYVGFHGMRHNFASQLYEVTKDLLLVRDTLGHANIATTNRYVHRLNSKLTGSTDGLLAGASFLNTPASVIAIR